MNWYKIAKETQTVQQIAKQSGYSIKAYHGTSNDFTVFDATTAGKYADHQTAQLGFFFTQNKNEASSFGNNVMNVFLKINKPYITDWDSIKEKDGYDLQQILIEKGHDSVIIRDYQKPDYYVVFSPNQIKSSDPTTYDDSNQKIPLEERFNPSNPDIRY